MKQITVIFILLIVFIPTTIRATGDIYKAQVQDVLLSENVLLEGFEISTIRQTITFTLLEGPNKGKNITFTQDKFEITKGEIIFVEQIEGDRYQVLEKNRMFMIWSIITLFVFLVLLLNGLQGFKSIIGLGISFVLIIFVLLPLVLKGFNPLLVSVLIGGVILSLVLFLSHGYNKGSIIALIGTTGAIVCAGVLSLIVSSWMKLTGLGDDEAVSALMVTGGIVNFSELLLAGIIIGMLGVLDDIAITQVAVVSEIKKANPALSLFELFTRALRVGKEHVSALVNTLVLAYTGASFPLLILLYTSGIRIDMLLSQEIVVAEIVRTIVGSIGLIIAVPLTTYLAARFLKQEDHIESHCAHTHH